MAQGVELSAYTKLLAQLPGLHWWQNKDGSRFAFAPACRSILGTAEAPTPLHWQQRIHPFDRQKRAYTLHTLAEGDEQTLEYRLLASPGTYTWVQENVRYTYAAEGDPVLLSSATVCVAPIYYRLLNNSNQYFILLDPGGHVVEMNQRAQQLLGPPSDQLIGRPLWCSPAFTNRQADDASQLSARLQQAASGQEVHFQHWVQAWTGQERYARLSVRPLLDAQGSLEYLMLEGSPLEAQALHSPPRQGGNGLLASDTARQQTNLQRTTARLKALIEGSRDPICALDLAARPFVYNTAFAEEFWQIYGVAIDPAQSLEALLGHLPDEYASAMEVWGRALQGEEFTILKELGLAERERNYYEISFSSIRDEEGQLIGASSISRNVSRERRIQKELKDAKEFLILAENLPQIIFTARTNGQIDYLNHTFFQYSNLPAGQAERIRWQQVIHPEDAPQVEQQWLEAVKSNAPGLKLELRLRNRHGLYRWHVARAVPLYYSAPHPVKWIGIIGDIHEAKIASAEERLAAEEFKVIAEGLPHIVWTAPPNGAISYFNNKWYDYTGEASAAGSLEGWIACLHPSEQEKVRNRWKKAVSNKSSFQMEFRIKHKTGGYRWFLGRALPIADLRGTLYKWLGTCTDIHENKLQRKRLQTQNERLNQINQYLDNFVHAAAHDLRSPVANMKGLMQLLQGTGNGLQQKVIESMEASLYRLDNTLQAMIHSIELQSLKQSPSRKLNVQEMFSNVQQEFSDRLKAVPHRIDTSFENCPDIVFIPFYLESLFRNLLSNAIKYRKEGQELHIQVGCRSYRNYKLITFSDNGIGIDLEKYGSKLFRPFQRFTHQAGGKGIGLHLINNIVTKTGGKIEVKSKPGEGITFLLYLKDLEK
ncbi:PAS domain-containing protein [Cesiribacter andamanensis]|uniref:histidine kinase n=1 Tax=Cesiribacter andamanensis AMV16 TaxID=1279009 RepID=M7N6D6_9BACT|nr:PAS domain-containing protein [Cesiribacter andamanensis]EMR04188.1 Alginate biosynthesis sensor protein kinB [Cesiribacter andamanensis AMV16]